MSTAFLDSEWDHLKEIELENLFVILTDDATIDQKCLKPEVSQFLKSSRRLLKWSDPHFWKKIR